MGESKTKRCRAERKKEFLDYYLIELNQEDKNYQKNKKKVLTGTKKTQNRNHAFRHLTRHAGKGGKIAQKGYMK